jgi:hypothetical protein
VAAYRDFISRKNLGGLTPSARQFPAEHFKASGVAQAHQVRLMAAYRDFINHKNLGGLTPSARQFPAEHVKASGVA